MDWIQGNKFADMADFTYSPPVRFMDDYYLLPNTLNIDRLKDVNIVFTAPFYVKDLFGVIGSLPQKFILITHNGDNEVNDRGVGYMDGKGNYIRTDEFTIPANVIRWYATNVNTLNPKIEAIPSGLENNKWRPEARKKEKMIETLATPRTFKNWVYMDHSTTWNIGERKGLYDLLAGEPWVTSFSDGANFDRFLENVYSHRFVISPRGNGIATHREWECLYMGTIPIQKRDLNNRFFTNLPICFVDDWQEVTKDFLEREYERITHTLWYKEILNFAYWENKIRNRL